MEVQVVLREIEEARHVERDSVDAPQRQRMGGNLHDHVGHAVVKHLLEEPLQCGRLGSRQVAGHRPAVDSGTRGADEPRALAGRQQSALEQIRRGGLARGAGDADDRELFRRPTVRLRRHRAEHRADVVDEQDRAIRATGVLQDFQPGRIGEDRRGRRLVGVRRAVDPGAGQGREQPALRGLGGVELDSGDRKIRSGVRGGAGRQHRAADQFGEVSECDGHVRSLCGGFGVGPAAGWWSAVTVAAAGSRPRGGRAGRCSG